MKGRPAPERTIIIDGKPLPEVLDEAMVHAVVHGFYDEIRKDDLLGPIFNGHIAPVDWPVHLAKMCDFWSATLLRTDRYEGFNTPSLLGIYNRVHFLHDGRAKSLEQLLTGPHNPAKVAGTGELTSDELHDLIEYLKSL